MCDEGAFAQIAHLEKMIKNSILSAGKDIHKKKKRQYVRKDGMKWQNPEPPSRKPE